MKLTINSKELLKAIQTVGGLIKPQNTMPILDNVLFDLQPGKLFLTADNLEVRSTIEMAVTFEGTVQACVPFALFVSMLKGFSNGPVDIVFSDKVVSIKSTTSSYDIPVNPDDVKDFPVSKEEECDNKVTLNSLEFVEAVKRAYSFADKSNADSLSTVLVWIQEAGTRVVGCTKHVFYEATIPVTGAESKLLLSLSTAQYLTGSILNEEDVEMCYSDNQVYLKLEGREISAVLYDGKYPNYDRLFDTVKTNKSYQVDKDVLFPALKRIINITDKNCYAILFTFNENKLDLDFKHSMLNTSAKEVLDIEYVGAPVSIGLNATNVSNILNSVDGELTMELSTPNQPCLLKADNTRCLFTPMNM